ncbi:MAG: hypothetical protein R2745_02600 [Vicinamibacterales bacterium]
MRHQPAAIVAAVSVVGALAAAPSPRPASATALLAGARQLVLVTTAGWNDVSGTVHAFERDGAGAWIEARRRTGRTTAPVAAGVSIVVGKNGVAWDPGVVAPVAGPVKAEGDGRSPAGVFALGTAFGFAPAAEAAWLRLPYVEVSPGLECVDDTASARYNELVDRASSEDTWTSSEKMREISPAYHWGVVVEYNTRPVVPGRGSCIFLHIGGEGGRGTAGCTAMTESALTGLMRWLDPARQPVLVQLPREALAALRTAWSLPALPAAR